MGVLENIVFEVAHTIDFDDMPGEFGVDDFVL